MSTYRHITDLVKQNSLKYVIGVLLLTAIAGLRLIAPWIIGVLIDQIVAKTLTLDFTISMMLLIFGVEVIIFIFRFFWRKLIAGSARYIETALREKLFIQLEKLGANFYIENKTGDLMARATNDLKAVRRALGMGVVMITDAIVITLMTIGIMAYKISPNLTFYALIPLPIMALIITIFGPVVQRRFKRVNEAFSNLSERVRETFSGIRIIKTFVRFPADSIRRRFDLGNRHLLWRQQRLTRSAFTW